MSPKSRPEPDDPHDLRLGMPKLAGWEIIPWLLTGVASFGLAFVASRTRSGIEPSLRDAYALLSAAWIAHWLANWARERQARRGRRASWFNAWDALHGVCLGAAIARGALVEGGLSDPIVFALCGLLALAIWTARARRRRARAKTPAQRVEAAFE